MSTDRGNTRVGNRPSRYVESDDGSILLPVVNQSGELPSSMTKMSCTGSIDRGRGEEPAVAGEPESHVLMLDVRSVIYPSLHSRRGSPIYASEV